MQVRYSNWCMRISKLRCSEMHAVSNGKDVDAAALVGFHSVKQIAVSLTATLGILIGCVAYFSILYSYSVCNYVFNNAFTI